VGVSPNSFKLLVTLIVGVGKWNRELHEPKEVTWALSEGAIADMIANVLKTSRALYEYCAVVYIALVLITATRNTKLASISTVASATSGVR
jgi:hypothetical protein